MPRTGASNQQRLVGGTATWRAYASVKETHGTPYSCAYRRLETPSQQPTRERRRKGESECKTSPTAAAKAVATASVGATREGTKRRWRIASPGSATASAGRPAPLPFMRREGIASPWQAWSMARSRPRAGGSAACSGKPRGGGRSAVRSSTSPERPSAPLPLPPSRRGGSSNPGTRRGERARSWQLLDVKPRSGPVDADLLAGLACLISGEDCPLGHGLNGRATSVLALSFARRAAAGTRSGQPLAGTLGSHA
jgi:hypothetical protein